MSAWPAGLPQCMMLDGYGEQPQDNAVRFQPEVGPPKMRRRGTAAGKVIEGSLILTTAERATFDTFYDDTLLSGTDAFTWKDYGNGPGTYVFAAPPHFGLFAPGRWIVTLQLLRYA